MVCTTYCWKTTAEEQSLNGTATHIHATKITSLEKVQPINLKMMHLFGPELSPERVAEMLERDLCGELS